VDPGTKTGIAVLDMHGTLLHLSSRRNMGRSGVIKLMSKYGKPLIVAVDVNPAPKNVEKIASSIGSLLYFPEKPMLVKEKNDIVKRFRRNYKKEHGIEMKIGDRHERDALAACVKAWKGNSYLLRKVDNALRKRGLEKIFDNVVKILLKKESENISNAIEEVLGSEKKKVHAK
jgi:predicted RNase H-like nuclease (RuvC/YqgF family)